MANPQFLSTYLTGNFGNSTYNSLQISGNKRFGRGFSMQGSYVWSKALGEDSGDSSTLQGDYRMLQNMSLDKQLLSFDHRSVFKLNGIYEIPLGRGRTYGKNMNIILDTLIGGWQMGWIYNYATGAPFTITAQNTVTNFATSYTPELASGQSLPTASISVLPGYVTMFPGLTQVVDPQRATVTSVGGLNAHATLFAIANSSGTPILINPAAGQLGNVGLQNYTAPPTDQVDLNLQKSFRITERFNFQLRATATNALNHTEFSAPSSLSISSLTFGHITTTAQSNRIMVLQARLNF